MVLVEIPKKKKKKCLAIDPVSRKPGLRVVSGFKIYPDNRVVLFSIFY